MTLHGYSVAVCETVACALPAGRLDMPDGVGPIPGNLIQTSLLSCAWLAVAGFLAAALLRAISATLRVRVAGPEPPSDQPVLFAFLHGRQFGLFRYPRRRRIAVLSSLSRDGRLQAAILSRLGFTVVSGSSSHGGAAGLLGLGRKVRAGLDAAFAVDGPKGPYGRVKPGIVHLARSTGAVIVPITFFAARGLELRAAWDRYLLPRPLTRTLILRGEPLEVPCGGGRAGLETARQRLEQALEELNGQAGRLASEWERKSS